MTASNYCHVSIDSSSQKYQPPTLTSRSLLTSLQRFPSPSKQPPPLPRIPSRQQNSPHPSLSAMGTPHDRKHSNLAAKKCRKLLVEPMESFYLLRLASPGAHHSRHPRCRTQRGQRPGLSPSWQERGAGGGAISGYIGNAASPRVDAPLSVTTYMTISFVSPVAGQPGAIHRDIAKGEELH